MWRADRDPHSVSRFLPIAHRQVVLTSPRRLRMHTRFDRKLLGKLSSCAWTCLKAEAQRLVGHRRKAMVGYATAFSKA